MVRLVLFVLDNTSRLIDVLSAWKSAGVSGATAVDGIGLGRAMGYLTEDTPLFPSLAAITEAHKGEVRIIFAVIDERVDLDDLIARTEAVVGNLDTAHTGILVTLPVDAVKGLRKRAGA